METRKSRLGLDTSRTNESETHRKGSRIVIILIATFMITVYLVIPAQEAMSGCSHEARVEMQVNFPWIQNWQHRFEIKRAKYCCKRDCTKSTPWSITEKCKCKYCGPNNYELVMTNFVHQVLHDNPVGQKYMQYCRKMKTSLEGSVSITCNYRMGEEDIYWGRFQADFQEHTVHVSVSIVKAGGPGH